jgi:hypothetical protein
LDFGNHHSYPPYYPFYVLFSQKKRRGLMPLMINYI